MIIYRGSVDQFSDDVRHSRIADIMQETFKNYYGYSAQESEYRSWANSYQYVKNIIEISKLQDAYLCLEYQIPYNNGRIDCLLFGKSVDGKDYTVLIELKQWSGVIAIDGEDNFVETYTGRGNRQVAHPSQQIEGYTNYLYSFVEVFETEPVLDLFSCSYCHNYTKTDGVGLFAPQFTDIIAKFPVYTKNDIAALGEKLQELLGRGSGLEIFNRFMQSPVRPSKKLLESTAKIINNQDAFPLLNEQIVARNKIVSKVNAFIKNKEKSVVIIRGGPGTGKSVIAMHVLAEFAAKNKKILFACKSKPFIEAIKSKVGKKSSILFNNLNAVLPKRVAENELDILLIDEAHRIGKSSNHQFTPAELRTDMPQIEQLIRSAKTTVFFIDDMQSIRSLEIGSTQIIRETARKYDCTIEEIELTSQFRCNGSDNYLDWLESVLGYKVKPKMLRKEDNFDVKIFDSPSSLYAALGEKEKARENSSRLVAGFCWEWSKSLDVNRNLVPDVKIGDFAMPWETHDSITPPAGYVKWYEWAYKPEGFKQVGCIYTVQGFEFDYIGVIIGPDLKYDSAKDRLTTDINATRDSTLKRGKDKFDQHVKNIYRVLMSRGMKGCYLYFCDKDVEKYFKRFISSEML